MRFMTRSRRLSALCFLWISFSVATGAQSCPKVSYTTPAATTRQMVTSVNCLVARTPAGRRTEANKAGFLVESFPIIGPQHTRRYRKIVLAVVSVPTGNETKTGLVTPDNPTATVAGTAGAECKVKINSDNSVDAQCTQTGGNIFVVYNN
jgi:hypothetical protein